MRFNSLLEINAYVNGVDFHYTKCGMANLLQKSCTVPRGCLRYVIVVYPDHTHLLFVNRTLDNKALYGLETMHESIYACHICNASFQKKPYFYYF